jgi:hypothetical protein
MRSGLAFLGGPRSWSCSATTVLLGCASPLLACGDDATGAIETGDASSSSGMPATGSSTEAPSPDSTGSSTGSTGEGSTGTGTTIAADSSTGPAPVCGDGLIEGAETCDGEALDGQTCETQGFSSGRLACAADCSGFDTGGCAAPVCGNGLVEGAEACDGGDLGGASCRSEGFDNGTLACAPDCSAFNTGGCGMCGNFIVEAGEACDSPLLFGQTCLTLGFDSGQLACMVDCLAFDTSGCGTCGNLVIDGAEPCDGSDLAGQTCASLGRGFDSGQLQCNATCTALVTSGCGTCGNLVIDGAEPCDGALLGGQSCASQGYDSGLLACLPDCTGLDTSGCGTCGNGAVDGSEACDGDQLGGHTCASLGLGGGTLSCSAACGFDTSGCDVVGASFGTDGFYQGLVIEPPLTTCDEISGTGVATGLGNNAYVIVPLGFSFVFYGTPFTEVAISSNGTLYFGADATLGLTNSCMPGNTPYVVDDHIIAAFWDDLDPAAAGEVYHQTLGAPGDQRFVVQWDAPNFGGSVVDLMRIQAVLHQSGTIDVCYVDTINAGNPGDEGAEATAGIQRDPAVALQHSCNTPALTSGRQLVYVPL